MLLERVGLLNRRTGQRIGAGKGAWESREMAEMLTKIDLVILDELGYLPFSPSGGALLFHLLSTL